MTIWLNLFGETVDFPLDPQKVKLFAEGSTAPKQWASNVLTYLISFTLGPCWGHSTRKACSEAGACTFEGFKRSGSKVPAIGPQFCTALAFDCFQFGNVQPSLVAHAFRSFALPDVFRPLAALASARRCRHLLGAKLGVHCFSYGDSLGFWGFSVGLVVGFPNF